MKIARKRLAELLGKAFEAGFEASAEGFNAEYGCSFGDLEKLKDEAVSEILRNGFLSEKETQELAR